MPPCASVALSEIWRTPNLMYCNEPLCKENAMPGTFTRGATLFATIIATHATVSMAQSAANYPTRPIRMIVPFAPGGSNDIMGHLFQHMSGMKLIVVIYKDSFPSLVDTMAGQGQINLGSLIQTIPHFKGGKIRALATSGGKRAAPTPELPTIAEAGIPGFEASNWWAVGAPAGTPAAIVTKLNQEIERYLELPDIVKRFAAEGMEPAGSTPQQLSAWVRNEIARWSKVVRDAGIQAQGTGAR
jgi:tripartite-type tricarboxylate transporter receptor subunit TctC